MNLNLSKVIKDYSFDLKENNSINNWIRVLDTSNMTVIDRLILDNHRRQILKNLWASDEDSFSLKPSENSRNRPSLGNQSFESAKADHKPAYRKLNESYQTGCSSVAEDCADRLYNDAVLRNAKFSKLQQEKEQSELEAALESANLHHPKRKLNAEVFTRLISEEKIIKSLYDKVPLSECSSTRPRRFSSSEQKVSVDRLSKKRGISLSAQESYNDSNKRLHPDQLTSLISRLYTVKLTPKEPVRRPRGPKVGFSLKSTHKLKGSMRYAEKELDRLIEGESVDYGAKTEAGLSKKKTVENSSPDLKSQRKSSVENLEVKLLKYEKFHSPVVSEVAQGSPEKADVIHEDSFIETVFIDASKSICTDYGLQSEKSVCECVNTMSHLTSIIDNSVCEYITSESQTLSMPALVFKPNGSPQTNLSDVFIEEKPFMNSGFGNLTASTSILDSTQYSPEILADISNNPSQNSLTAKYVPKDHPSLKILPLPKSIYLEPELSSPKAQLTNYSQESLYLMRNPLQSLNGKPSSPSSSKLPLDSYRFIVGISENDEFIYAD